MIASLTAVSILFLPDNNLNFGGNTTLEFGKTVTRTDFGHGLSVDHDIRQIVLQFDSKFLSQNFKYPHFSHIGAILHLFDYLGIGFL